MTTDDDSTLTTYQRADDLVMQRRDGSLSDEDMTTALLAHTYTAGNSDPSVLGSGYVAGSWDAVRRARQNGLLSDEEFRVLFEQCHRVPQAPPPVS